MQPSGHLELGREHCCEQRAFGNPRDLRIHPGLSSPPFCLHTLPLLRPSLCVVALAAVSSSIHLLPCLHCMAILAAQCPHMFSADAACTAHMVSRARRRLAATVDSLTLCSAAAHAALWCRAPHMLGCPSTHPLAPPPRAQDIGEFLLFCAAPPAGTPASRMHMMQAVMQDLADHAHVMGLVAVEQVGCGS